MGITWGFSHTKCYINWIRNGDAWIIMKISFKFPYKSDYSLGTCNLIWFPSKMIKIRS
jgi:hypothetical protein